MRACVAALLVLCVLASAGAPHVHAQSSGGDECAACVLRHASPPHSQLPDVAPIVQVAGDALAAPGLPPVCGAPLGAIPGQSPPAGA
jgi:hypothetical protein